MKLAESLGLNASDKNSPTGVLVSVGCNSYFNVSPLGSAESDAKAIFTSLTQGDRAVYSDSLSKLLLSPSNSDFSNAFTEVVKNRKGIDVFTLYFAGHGIIQNGSFYICLSDVSLDSVSTTAINVSNILRAICEIRPRHAYIILDACYSGGAALDLISFLRSDILAQAPSFGISVLSSAHMTKEALENIGGGIFTQKLLSAVNGTISVNDNSRFLGLGEIVRKLPISSSDELEEQAPNFSDLNLTGADIFCPNPLHVPSENIHATDFGTLKLTQHRYTISPALSADIWKTFLGASSPDLAELFSLFDRIIAEQIEAQADVCQITESVSRSFSNAVNGKGDTFSPALVYAAMTKALLRYLPNKNGVEFAITRLAANTVNEAVSALAQLRERMDTDEYCLLSRRGGPADLYFLPLRLSKILGWIGLCIAAKSQRLGVNVDETALRDLTKKLLARYGNSIVAVGDDQSPYMLSFLAACKLADWVEEAEEVVGRLYLDITENFGRVLINEPTSADILQYLLAKHEPTWDFDADFLQRPSDLISAIFVGAAMFKLDDAIDPSLVQMDHTHLSFYIPESYSEFWKNLISGGLNRGYQIGHGIWSINDVRRVWRHDIAPGIEAAMSNAGDPVWISAYISSMISPDRLPLFIVPTIDALPDSIPAPQNSG